MSDPNYRLSISNVVTNTLGVISRNPFIFIGLSLIIVGVPQLLIGIAAAQPGAPAGAFALLQRPGMAAGAGFSYLVLVLVSVVLQGALIVATANDLSGRPVDFGGCAEQALKKLLPLIGMAIVIGFGVMIGLLLLIIPGIILYLMWMIAVPVMVVEDRGVFESLSRSAELTKGSRLWLFLLIIVFLVFSVIIAIPFGLLSVLGSTLTPVVNALVSALNAAIGAAGIASVYIDLRVGKEGSDTASLAEVFA